MKQRIQKVWKFTNFTLKDIMSTKTMKDFVRVDDFQEPLEIWFMAFIDPYKVHVLSKPRSKLNQNRSWTIHFQNN